MFKRIFLILCLILASTSAARAADPFIVEPLRVPLGADSGTLEALFVRPSVPGRYPLALLAHGSPRDAAERPTMSPLQMLPQAMEFARRGFAVVIVMRRGFGGSDGGFAEDTGGCNNPDYVRAGRAAASDLKKTLELVSHRSDVDATRMIAVGVSAGGFANVALTDDPPPGLVAAISFAGGRGSTAPDTVCSPDREVSAFRTLGKSSRLPMLWVYAANDRFFGPALAQEFYAAFTGAGGRADFIAAPAFGPDGHFLFSPSGIALWTPYVDKFLQQQNLTLRTELLPLPQPTIAAPNVLSNPGKAAFAAYLVDAPHKAFALAPDGAFGWKTGMRTTNAARAAALKICQQHGKVCSVQFVDGAAVVH